MPVRKVDYLLMGVVFILEEVVFRGTDESVDMERQRTTFTLVGSVVIEVLGSCCIK